MRPQVKLGYTVWVGFGIIEADYMAMMIVLLGGSSRPLRGRLVVGYIVSKELLVADVD